VAGLLRLDEAVRELVRDGDSVALEGFPHLIPFAAGHEVARRRRRELTLIRMTPDLIYDQLIGMACARKLVFSWRGNPRGVGSLHRFEHRKLVLTRTHPGVSVEQVVGDRLGPARGRRSRPDGGALG
jgi:acyl CoA:acetate/3-ketoacid CoA transferase alpha subunit